MVERFHLGQRVRLKKTLATKPPGLFRRGATGTVTNVDVGESEGETRFWVMIDRHFPRLAPRGQRLAGEMQRRYRGGEGPLGPAQPVWPGD
jgi:hypothetical protein